MKDILKNPYIVSGIVFILALVGIAWNIGAGSGGKLILQPDTSSVVSDTVTNVDTILPEPSVAEETDEIIPEAPDENELGDIGGPIIDQEHVMGDIVVNDFGPMMSISSPLSLTGTAPRTWFFEGIFPVTLMTLEGEIITESYASGDWLSPIGDNEELGADDMIEFTSTIEFQVPNESTGEAKIRFTKDNTSRQFEDVYVEQQVIFGE